VSWGQLEHENDCVRECVCPGVSMSMSMSMTLCVCMPDLHFAFGLGLLVFSLVSHSCDVIC
jgi:hypothetical protein